MGFWRQSKQSSGHYDSGNGRDSDPARGRGVRIDIVDQFDPEFLRRPMMERRPGIGKQIFNEMHALKRTSDLFKVILRSLENRPSTGLRDLKRLLRLSKLNYNDAISAFEKNPLFNRVRVVMENHDYVINDRSSDEGASFFQRSVDLNMGSVKMLAEIELDIRKGVLDRRTGIRQIASLFKELVIEKEALQSLDVAMRRLGVSYPQLVNLLDSSIWDLGKKENAYATLWEDMPYDTKTETMIWASNGTRETMSDGGYSSDSSGYAQHDNGGGRRRPQDRRDSDSKSQTRRPRTDWRHRARKSRTDRGAEHSGAQRENRKSKADFPGFDRRIAFFNAEMMKDWNDARDGRAGIENKIANATEIVRRYVGMFESVLHTVDLTPEYLQHHELEIAVVAALKVYGTVIDELKSRGFYSSNGRFIRDSVLYSEANKGVANSTFGLDKRSLLITNNALREISAISSAVSDGRISIEDAEAAYAGITGEIKADVAILRRIMKSLTMSSLKQYGEIRKTISRKRGDARSIVYGRGQRSRDDGHDSGSHSQRQDGGEAKAAEARAERERREQEAAARARAEREKAEREKEAREKAERNRRNEAKAAKARAERERQQEEARVLAELRSKDFYELLSVGREASDRDIKRAFRAAAFKHHPDKGGNSKIFNLFREAYETLVNPSRRARYDRFH